MEDSSMQRYGLGAELPEVRQDLAPSEVVARRRMTLMDRSMLVDGSRIQSSTRVDSTADATRSGVIRQLASSSESCERHQSAGVLVPSEGGNPYRVYRARMWLGHHRVLRDLVLDNEVCAMAELQRIQAGHLSVERDVSSNDLQLANADAVVGQAGLDDLLPIPTDDRLDGSLAGDPCVSAAVIATVNPLDDGLGGIGVGEENVREVLVEVRRAHRHLVEERKDFLEPDVMRNVSDVFLS